jgi:hypothetical protein
VPDETTPDLGNSVENAAAPIDWDSPDNPYLKRYTDTQSEYTRNQQRLKELERYEQDPQAFIELGKTKGWVEVAQTPTTLASVLKERWTDDTIQKQWLGDDSLLSRFESVQGTVIGKQAQTPIWSDLNSGGYTSIGSGGGSLNSATNQTSAQATWTLVYHYFPISLEISTLNQSASNLQSVISGKNMEIQGAIASVRNQGTRQLVTNGDGKVAACATAGSSATYSLTASASEGTAYGYSSIVRDWLRPGAVVDIGTTADTDSLVSGETVTAVAESATAPTITVTTVPPPTAGTHFVYIKNPNSTTAANTETNGLRNIVNTTGSLGGIDPPRPARSTGLRLPATRALRCCRWT